MSIRGDKNIHCNIMESLEEKNEKQNIYPALLLTTVNPLIFVATKAVIKFSGIPHKPNPRRIIWLIALLRKKHIIKIHTLLKR